MAKKKDLSNIVAIYNESIAGRKATADTEEISVESRQSWFIQHTNQRPLWVFEKNNEIAGWLSFQNFYGRSAYQSTAEVSLYVKSSYHQQGIGKNLLMHALENSRVLHISNLLAFIFAHNEPSIKLFTSVGFNQWGYLPGIAQLDGLEKDLTIYGQRTHLKE